MFEKYAVEFYMGPTPKKPVMPKQPENMLDVQALKTYTENVEKYNSELQNWKENRKKRHEKECELYKNFENDLAADAIKRFGFKPEICKEIFCFAEQNTSSNSFEDISNKYEDIAIFVNQILKINKIS